MPPFSLGNADELRMLADDAGLVNVQVQPVTLISVFTSVEGFVEAIAAGANTTRKALEAFDEDTRASIGASVANALERYLDDDELRLPMEANILTATV